MIEIEYSDGMPSIREIYRIGRGPSSSHTMGPALACRTALTENPDADYFKVTLFGSLAKTGKGHRTDYAIEKTFKDIPVRIIFNTEKTIYRTQIQWKFRHLKKMPRCTGKSF